MLSEVSPVVGDWNSAAMNLSTIKDQAKDWYQIDLKSNDFVECALELREIAAKSGQRLIIRDWTFGSFFSFGKNASLPPDKLVTLEDLEGKCDVIPFCFVRDAIDVWLSLRMRLKIDMETFFKQYLKYVQAICERKLRTFRYEDFVRRFEHTVRQICQYTGLEFSDSYKNYMFYDKVSGDMRFDPLSRGRKANTIKEISRRYLPKKLVIKLNRCEEMIRANELLGYSTSYYDVDREAVQSAIRERCSRFIYGYRMVLTRRLKRWSNRLIAS